MTNVAVLFEGRNFYAGCKAWARDRTVDFKKLLAVIAEQTGGTVCESTYYLGVDDHGLLSGDSAERINKAIQQIKEAGITVRTFPLRMKVSKCPECGVESDEIVEKQVDSAITVDAMQALNRGNIDLFVLVSSDTDLIPLAQALTSCGKRVWVVCWKPESVSNSLASCVQNIVALDPLREQFLNAPAAPTIVTQDAQDAFKKELEEAEAQFSSGYVGLHYFLRNWRSGLLPTSVADRSAILNQLIANGEVLQYGAPDGSMAIKRNR